MKLRAVLPNFADLPADDFVAEFPVTTMVGINLDQRSAAQLKSCIIPWDDGASGELAWAAERGKAVYLKGRNVLWSVPFPGAAQMEAVLASAHDDLYIAIAYQLIASMKAGRWAGDCWVRLFWEFNLWENTENRALDKDGKPSAALYKRAYRHIAGLMQRVFTREGRVLKLAFSPSVERRVVVDWEEAYPGKAFVDAFLPDLYMCLNFGQTPGVYTGGWFRDPFLRMRTFCEKKLIPIGFGEIGVDDDTMAPDLEMALADAVACKSGWAIIQWWHDWQVTNCFLLGRMPAVQAVVRRVLG